MKKLFLIIFLFTITYSVNAQTLEILSTPDIKEIIRDISFVDGTHGWLAGNNGILYKTTNSGSSWSELTTNTDKDLAKVSFVDVNNGWMGTVDGSVFKTTDGGLTWVEFSYAAAVPTVAFSILDLMKFFDANTGFIIAGKLRSIYLLKTTNGGETWAVKDSLVSATLLRRWYDITFNGNDGVLVGDKKDLQRYSTNFGETWTNSTAIVDNFFRDQKYVKFLTDTEVITMGEGNEFSGVMVPVYKSTDKGMTWTKKSQSFTNIYDRVKAGYFKNSLEGVAVGSDGFSKAFFTRTTDGGETWSSTALDFAFGLQALYGNGDFLFALGTSGHFIYSNDFGVNWHILPLKAPTSVVSIKFFNNKGFAITRNSDVYFNADGKGHEWSYLSQAGRNISSAMTVTPNNNLFILKENRHIVKSTDFAQTWRTVSQPVNPNARNLVGGIDFADDNTGYAFFSLNDYSEYYILKTTDAGETWNQSLMIAGPGYISGGFVAFDADNGVALGPDRWALRTTDGGVNWAQATLNNFPVGLSLGTDFEQVAKIDENRAFAIGEKFMSLTTDKGANWNYIEHGIADIDSGFYKVAFSGDSLGYVALYNGLILRTTNLGNSWSLDSTFAGKFLMFGAGISQTGKPFFGTSTGYILGERTIVGVKDNYLPGEFALKQNYPNPFNPSTKIEFRLNTKEHVLLKIYDVLGREVEVLVNEIKSAGMHSIDFNASKLSSGVYLYTITTANNIETKKMILTK
jgi:photosystem II stability/assembly factor-like uncharacterized protein